MRHRKIFHLNFCFLLPPSFLLSTLDGCLNHPPLFLLHADETAPFSNRKEAGGENLYDPSTLAHMRQKQMTSPTSSSPSSSSSLLLARVVAEHGCAVLVVPPGPEARLGVLGRRRRRGRRLLAVLLPGGRHLS